MRVLSFFLFLLSGLAQNTIAQRPLREQLDSFLMTQAKPDEPGGVVLVSKNGNVLYKKAVGMADMELNVPVNDSMIFYIGSNTKQFTAVAILQLMEKGKLQLQDTLGKFLAAAPFPVSSITLRELLSHTSGITEKNETIIKKLLAGQRTDDSLVNDIVPGKKWEYSNIGFSVLGFIIEKLTGMSYAECIREHILKPAGMVHSFVDDNVSVIKNRADGYSYYKGKIRNSRPTNTMGAAGGIMSTVEDMLRWTQVLQSGILLKTETLQQAFTPQKLKDGSATGYGFGWYLEELRGSTARRHGGRTLGYTSETLYLPQEAVYVIMLTNTQDPVFPIRAVTRIVAGIAINKPYVFKDQPIKINELQKFIGLYENAYNELVNITEQNGKLVFQRPNGNPYNLGYAGNNEFFFHKDFLRVHFITSPAGTITSLQFSKVGMDMTEWFKTQKPVLKLSSGRIEDSILRGYAGKYFLSRNDTITISREGVNLYYKTNKQPELLLAAEDATHFFILKNNSRLTFIKDSITNAAVLSVTENKKTKRYLKL